MKIQNNVSIYDGVVLEDHVFCGPSVVFTNVANPRSEIERKSEYRHHACQARGNARRERDHRVWYDDRELCIRRERVPSSPATSPTMRSWSASRPSASGWMCTCGERLSFDEGSGTCSACDRSFVVEATGLVERREVPFMSVPLFDAVT